MSFSNFTLAQREHAQIRVQFRVVRAGLYIAAFVLLAGARGPSPSGQKGIDAQQEHPKIDKPVSKPSTYTAEKNAAQNASNQSSSALGGAQNERDIRIVGPPPRSAGDTIGLVCTVLLTITGIVGIVIAICTLYKIGDQAEETAKSAKAAADTVEAVNRQAGIMERQTKAAEDAAIAAKDNAEAARKSAEAFITESRPWLLLHKNIRPDDPHSKWQFRIKIQNFGKTPAKLIAYQAEMQMGDRSAPPDEMIFEKQRPFDSIILPQGEFVDQDFSAMGNDFGKAHAGEKYLWLCGLVRYEDVFESNEPRLHETMFCLRYEPLAGIRGGWVQGPRKYNAQSSKAYEKPN